MAALKRTECFRVQLFDIDLATSYLDRILTCEAVATPIVEVIAAFFVLVVTKKCKGGHR